MAIDNSVSSLTPGMGVDEQVVELQVRDSGLNAVVQTGPRRSRRAARGQSRPS